MTEAQQRALAAFSALLSGRGGAPQRLIVVDAEGRETEVPPAALGELLPAVAVAARVLADEPAGERELSTTLAARRPRASRQHLVDLLQAGAIPHRMVGAHRRVRLGDLRAYQERRRAARRALTRIGEEFGYDG